jgi:hypothetical protein
VFPGEGQGIVTAISFKGFLIVWKFPVGLYVIDTTDVSDTNWKVKRLNNSTGGISPLGAVIADDDVIFLDSIGNFQFLSAVQEFGDMSSRNLSKTADIDIWMRDNIDFSRLNKCQAVWYPKRREAKFALTLSGGSDNDIQVIIDFNRPDISRFRFSNQNICNSMWLRQESDNTQRHICGDEAGFVWKLDDETRSKDGLGYEGLFQTAHDDFNWFDKTLSVKRKQGGFLELVIEPLGNFTTDVDLFWDGDFEDTYPYNMGSDGATLGAFVLDTDVLSGAGVTNRKKRITGGGKRHSIIGRNDTPGESFSISKFLLYFIPGDEKI